MSSSLVMIGKVGRPHGIRGAFFFHPVRYAGSYLATGLDEFGEQQEPPFSFEEIMVGESADKASPFKVSAIRHSGGKLVISSPDIADRTMAEGLVGRLVFIGREKLNIDQDEYLWDDLLDRAVHDIDDLCLGKVVEIYNAGASDIVIVMSEDGRLLDLPLVEAYFQSDFGDIDGALRLLVKGDTFTELWRKQDDV